MKLSELITNLENLKKEHGDISVRAETGDGRSTWLGTVKGFSIRLNYTPWKGHSQRADVIRLEVGY